VFELINCLCSMKFCFAYTVLFWGIPICADAQMKMKSCCENPGVRLVSTVKQSKGTLRMAHILDSIIVNAKPEDYYVMNTLRAEQAKKKLETEKDPNKRFLLYYEYCVETLNAGNNDEAIAVLKQVMASMNMTEVTADNKLVFEQLAISYMRKGELENCAANHNPQSCIIPIQGD